MKNIWIIANWKSNKTIAEALDWVDNVGPSIPENENLKVGVCPTFSCLSEVKKAITVGNYPLMVGAQDLSPFDAGAYTGEESAFLLKGLIDLSILGHSERRQNFSETDEIITKKVAQALQNNIMPLICIQSQDTPVPKDCRLVAYEPVFAIGTGKADTPENANEVAKVFKQKYGDDLEVIYGGSVNSSNVQKFVSQPDITGVLVGNASLDAGAFLSIIKALEG
ncbi:triosephosphate isomerase [Candidatus Daviesbacteria bacterium]|nr:triosephosphate isomerase [Candidatus Daviesbacteria bacterium]